MSKAKKTRLTILEKSFELIYTKGYQTTSIDDILATTQVTKGAFYYHFKNKEEMGVAIIEEIIKPEMKHAFIAPLESSENFAEDAYLMIKKLLFETSFLKFEFGCPTGNLIQEMTPWNDTFSQALMQLIEEWQTAIEQAVLLSQQQGNLSHNVEAKQVGLFIVSSYWGIRNFGKALGAPDCYLPYLKELKNYLDSLK